MWGGGVFSGEGQEKILLCKGGHDMKNKNIRGVFCQLNLISNAKMRQKCKKVSNIEKIFLGCFAHSAFYNIYISKAAYRHAPVQYAKCVFFSSSFFLSSHHGTSPLLHLYNFRKKYNYILANINSESSRVRFSTSPSVTK